MKDKVMKIDADRAVNDIKNDRFGLSEIAKHLALSVMASSNQEGLVIAVEGKWGSGKSSLINLMQKHIDAAENNSVSTISFAPWLLGDKDNYVLSFMATLAAVIKNISDKNGSSFNKKEAKELLNQLIVYGGKIAGGVATLAEIIQFVDPNSVVWAKVLRRIASSSKSEERLIGIDEQKK